ncbi:MAG TPA: hypothetical protein VKR26_02630, partial [Terriglobales bacterium]|nr:hypothetical protein [Terriglobales bacterium]
MPTPSWWNTVKPGCQFRQVWDNLRAVPVADKSELYRRLPSVDELLRLQQITALAEREGHAAVAEAARAVLARVREEIAAGRLNSSGVELA